MVIVAGHITLDPELRESYLAGCMSVVERARRADGYLDFATTADLLDPGRVNLCALRKKQGPATLSVSVAEYDVADVRPLFGKGRA